MRTDLCTLQQKVNFKPIPSKCLDVDYITNVFLSANGLLCLHTN